MFVWNAPFPWLLAKGGVNIDKRLWLPPRRGECTNVFVECPIPTALSHRER